MKISKNTFLLVLVIVFLVSIGIFNFKQKNEAETNSKFGTTSLYLQLNILENEQRNIPLNEIVFANLINNTPYIHIYGYPFLLFRYEMGEWTTVPSLPSRGFFLPIMYLYPYSYVIKEFPIYFMHGILESGMYKITIDTYISREGTMDYNMDITTLDVLFTLP